jgi:hypothetical protein
MPRKKPAFADSDTAYLPSSPPALTPEARNSQLINLAVAQAEKQLREGTASSQIVVHYLKQASLENQIQLEILRNQSKYLEAKTKALDAATKMESTYEEVLAALKRYGGLRDDEPTENIFRTE